MTLSNREIDYRLNGKNLKRIDDYVNLTTKINFKCTICGNIELIRPDSVFSRNGCRECRNSKFSNNKIDKLLIEKNLPFKRIDEYINTQTKINFECLNCERLTNVKPASILGGFGCNNCHTDKEKYDNYSIDELLVGKNIMRIDNYINYDISINFKCLICDHIWMGRPGSVANGKRGCPNCALSKSRLTNKDIDDRMKNNKLKRIDDYKSSKKKIRFKCSDCDVIDYYLPRSCFEGSTCKHCSSKKSIGEKTLISIFKKHNIKYNEEVKIYLHDVEFNERPKRIDFYLPEYNLFIEYNGLQHYKPINFNKLKIDKSEIIFEKQILRDKAVKDLACKNAINFYEIDCRKYTGKKLKFRNCSFEEALDIDLYYELHSVLCGMHHMGKILGEENLYENCE